MLIWCVVRIFPGLGHPLTELVGAGGYPAQYFEKGHIEDYRPLAAGLFGVGGAGR